MKKNYNRTERISDLIQTALAEIIQRDAKGYGFGMVTITNVDVSHDLSYAKIYVSFIDEAKAKESISALNDAAKYLRYELAHAVKIRATPELKFIYDDSSVRGLRISSLINDALKDK